MYSSKTTMPHFHSQPRCDEKILFVHARCNIKHACYWAMDHHVLQTLDGTERVYVCVCALIMGEEAGGHCDSAPQLQVPLTLEHMILRTREQAVGVSWYILCGCVRLLCRMWYISCPNVYIIINVSVCQISGCPAYTMSL